MPVYLDHAATTPMPPEVLAAYTSALGLVGNPSSIHTQGQAAKLMLEDARAAVATSVGATPIEVTFTSGGTEAINLAIKGLFWRAGGNRILSTRAEHHATIDALEWLERHEGAVIDWIPVDAVGRIDLAALEAALGPTSPSSPRCGPTTRWERANRSRRSSRSPQPTASRCMRMPSLPSARCLSTSPRRVSPP